MGAVIREWLITIDNAKLLGWKKNINTKCIQTSAYHYKKIKA